MEVHDARLNSLGVGVGLGPGTPLERTAPVRSNASTNLGVKDVGD